MELAWKELDAQSDFNSNIAAQAEETFLFASRRYNIFNGLVVTNSGSVDILVYLDQLDIAGSVFAVPKNTTLILSPADGRSFRTLKQKNVDATNAEVADNILFRASYSEQVF